MARLEAGRSPREIARLVAQIADGLDSAHQAGLIHRDVKPNNILIERATGRAKITDFGLAREPGHSALTREGVVAGTPTYMSPEQARGDASLDHRTDIYGLGITLYESLTGRPPFTGPALAVLRRILEHDPIPPRRLDDAIPRDLETICLKAMAREPARRYQTARELAGDLGATWTAGRFPLARRRLGSRRSNGRGDGQRSPRSWPRSSRSAHLVSPSFRGSGSAPLANGSELRARPS